MAALIILGVLLLAAVLAPIFGTDTSDARSEEAHPERGWWPAGPAAPIRPRY